MDARIEALSQLFERLPHGVYIGSIASDGTSSTLAANAQLKTILGFAADAADPLVDPFDSGRFADPQQRRQLIEEFASKHRGQMAEDLDGAPVFLAKNSWEAAYVEDKSPEIRFLKTRERR